MDVHGRIARAISDALRDPEKLPEALILCGVLEAYGVLLAAVVFGVVEAFTGFWVSGDLAGRRRTVGVIVLWFSVLLVIIIAEAFLLRRQSSSCLGVRDTPCFAIATWGLQCFVNWSFAFFCCNLIGPIIVSCEIVPVLRLNLIAWLQLEALTFRNQNSMFCSCSVCYSKVYKTYCEN